MNILVTGGAGFIGSHITDEYIRRGHNVIILDKLSTGTESNINQLAKFCKKDIYSGILESIFSENSIEIINHHAAQIDLRKSQVEPVYDARINIEGSLRIFELAAKYGVKKIIFASSGGAIYGEQQYFPADEVHQTNPLSPYGIAKLTTEKYLEFFRSYYGIEYVCLRYANIYGPRQSLKGEGGVVSVFIQKILKGETPVINGDGEQTRDYVFVSDVVKANYLALNYGKSGIFNIGTKTETTVNELFRILNGFHQNRFSEVHGEEIKGEQYRSVLDNELAKKELNWEPEVKIDKGLEVTNKWFEDLYKINK